MLDKCISLCAKFPGEVLCEVCRRKAGIPPSVKRASARLSPKAVAQGISNKTWPYMRVRPNAKMSQWCMPQSFRDLTRAHIVRK